MVSFSSDDEKKVFEELTKIDSNLGKIYYSGLIVLRQKNTVQTQVSESPFSETTSGNENSQNDSNPFSENFIEENPDRIAQSAHSMRETMNVTLRHPKIISSASNLTFKTKVQKITDPQTNLPDFLQFTYSQLTDLHSWFTNVSHHGYAPSEQEYLTKVEEFTSLMRHILTPHYEVIQEIDEFIKKSSPDKMDLEKLEFLMSKNTQSYNYFFANAKGNWLEVLVEDGKYFKKVPIVIRKENSYSFPFWPEAYYLERIASEKPDLVGKIILQTPTPKKDLEKNSTVLRNFVGAALKMPPKLGKLIAEKAILEKWRDGMISSVLDRELADLMIKLVDSEFETSLKLCDFLLDVTLMDTGIPDMISSSSRKDVRSIIDRYSYETILKENIPVLYEKDHDVVIQILAKKLSKANWLASKTRQELQKDPNQDMSFVWRPAIEEHEQNYNFDIRSHLVATICRTMEKSESIGIDSLKKSLNVLAGQKYYIFRRLELYFYGKHPLDFIEEINRLCVEYFAKGSFRHEYYHMLKNSFPHLKSENKEIILDVILKGPNFEEFRGNPNEFEIYKKHWKIEKLSPIIEYLPELQEEYDSLVKEYGISNLTEFVSYHESFSEVKESSDLTEDMTVSQVIEFLKQYKIPENIFLEEDGTGRTFKEFVEKNPEEYSKHATELIECLGLFHYRFLDGLSKIKNKKLDWDAILIFCESIIIKSPPRDVKILDLILDYLGDLLQNNLLHNETAIPFALRDKIWNILNTAIKIAPPDTIWSENYPDKNWDAMGISINSSIGRLSHALLQYAVWCYYGLKNVGPTPTELVPEVKHLLESMLNPEQEQSVSIHAVLGHNFYNLLALDDKWTKSKIGSIFSHDEQHAKAGNASWDAYTFQQIYQKSFNALFEEYLYRIKNPGKRTDTSLNDSQQRFAQQIGLVYLHSLKRSDELFEYFLEKSDPQSLEDCLEWIGRALKDWKEKTPPKMNVSKLISYSKIKSNPSAGWLFLNPLMPRLERIKLLNSILDETKGEISPIYWIPEELHIFAEEYPLETIECIGKMIKHYQTSGEMYTMLRHFENIFPLILKTKHTSAIQKMKESINFLGSLGYEDFRKFLD
ncbi:MAG: hypothetical protein K8Q89_09555 [Nitrosarchaeum sp.]|nr:hypothetical protein [Nitrosarchaeum sp.]